MKRISPLVGCVKYAPDSQFVPWEFTEIETQRDPGYVTLLQSFGDFG